MAAKRTVKSKHYLWPIAFLFAYIIYNRTKLQYNLLNHATTTSHSLKRNALSPSSSNSRVSSCGSIRTINYDFYIGREHRRAAGFIAAIVSRRWPSVRIVGGRTCIHHFNRRARFKTQNKKIKTNETNWDLESTSVNKPIEPDTPNLSSMRTANVCSN